MTTLTAVTTSTEYTGTTTFPANNARRYFFVVMTSGEGTINFNQGTGEIPLKENWHFTPPICPLSEITVTTTGTFVVLMG